nr:von Willebrand factor type A domain-containing protein [Bacteroidales bacterium]
MKKNNIYMAALLALVISCDAAMYDMPDGFYYDSASGKMASGGDVPGEEQGGDRFDKIVENPFVETSQEPVSTFSVDADGAAYAYMRSCLRDGFLPDKNAVRIEEYLNYFTFNYSDPQDGATVALNAEAGPCPWNAQHKLLRLGIKGKSLEGDQIPQANFVFLIDVSGSMSSNDKLP